MRYLAIVLLTSGCGQFVDCPWPDDDMRQALSDFRAAYSEGIEPVTVDSVVVECVDASEIYVKGAKTYGNTYSKTHVAIPVKGFNRIGQTNLFHELTHVARWTTTGDAEADHNGWEDRFLDLITGLCTLHGGP